MHTPRTAVAGVTQQEAIIVYSNKLYLVFVLEVIQHGLLDEVLHCADASGARCLQTQFSYNECQLDTAAREL
jgi:hypothetical protein